jgi:hypothetical protein
VSAVNHNPTRPTIDTASGSGAPHHRRKVSVMTVVAFAAVVLLWPAFGAALVLRQDSLDRAWHAFRTAPLPLRVLEGVVLLPWVTGLAIWHGRWALWLRRRSAGTRHRSPLPAHRCWVERSRSSFAADGR